jgi:hypothetical protein
MTFETIGAYLEIYASDMGVMLLKIEMEPYIRLLGNLNNVSIDAEYVHFSFNLLTDISAMLKTT